MPNPLAPKGSISDIILFMSLSLANIRYTGRKVSWAGNIIVRSVIENSIFFPLKRYLAKAYAAGITVINCNIITEKVTIRLFLV